jgi:hypothetical protein
MWQKIVGSYDSGLLNIQVVAREGKGGEFFANPEKGCIPRIKVGVDYKEWGYCVDVLVHECMELFLTLQGKRYSKAPDLAYDDSEYLFSFTHGDLSACARLCSAILVQCLPDLADVYKKRNKKK